MSHGQLAIHHRPSESSDFLHALRTASCCRCKQASLRRLVAKHPIQRQAPLLRHLPADAEQPGPRLQVEADIGQVQGSRVGDPDATEGAQDGEALRCGGLPHLLGGWEHQVVHIRESGLAARPPWSAAVVNSSVWSTGSGVLGREIVFWLWVSGSGVLDPSKSTASPSGASTSGASSLGASAPSASTVASASQNAFHGH